MYGPMGPPPGLSDNKAEKMPKGIKNKVNFLIKNGKATAKRLMYIYRLVWEARPWILFLLAFMALFNGLSPVLSSYIAKWLLDGLASAASGTLKTFWTLGWILILQIVYQLVTQIINQLSGMVMRLANELLANSIKLKIMNKAKTIDLADFDLPEFYSKLENANREAGTRPLSVLNASFNIVSSIISLVSFIVILASVLPWAPVLIILMALPSTIISYKYRKLTFSFIRRRSKDRRQMDYYSNLIVDKDLVKEVKLFDLADTFTARYITIFKNYFKGMKNLIVKEGIWGLVIVTFSSIVNGGIFLKIAHMIFEGKLTVGDYSLYTNALFSITAGVSSIINTTAGIYEGTLYIDNLIEFMETKPTVVPTTDIPLAVDAHTAHTIRFENVSFKYPATDRYVLKNVSFTLKPGDTAVLVGLNGAGKTTLLKILTRLYDPTEGSVYLDGHNLKEYDVQQLYSIFGIIFQDFGKYAFSIKENIAFGNKNKINDMASVAAAAAKSDATGFIDKLPDGYNTPLMRMFEDNGIELSIGQWQKIAVARAFFRDSDVMILDEPTASLDPIAEQEIFSQFDCLRDGKTTIFVSHRLSSATIASKVIFLEDGEIVEMGSHHELMELDGKYAKLFTTQAKRYIDNYLEENEREHHRDDKSPAPHM